MIKYNNDNKKTICENCGGTDTTFEHRNIKIGSNADLIIPYILVAICSSCKNIINVPQHSGLILQKSLHI